MDVVANSREARRLTSDQDVDLVLLALEVHGLAVPSAIALTNPFAGSIFADTSIRGGTVRSIDAGADDSS